MSLIPSLLVCVIAAVGRAEAAIGAAPPDRWAEETARVVEQARAAGLAGGVSVSASSIGQSVEGRELLAVQVRGGSSAQAARRPTLVVIAGMDGRHVVGTRLAMKLIERMATDGSAVLAHADLVVVPCLNPDGLARFDQVIPREDNGANAARRTAARDDADRDRRMDEDGPIDLNGDGVITQMRVKRPRPGLLRGLETTEIVEPDAPRLMRRADAAKGEAGEFAVVIEGRDQDGDGLIAEDGAVGVDLDSNFPYHWPEFDGNAGPTPLSEPETRAIADWILSRPEVVAVLVIGPNDNLVSIPVGGKMDATGEVPISGGVLDPDKPIFELAAKLFKEATGITGVGGVSRSFDGSLVGWAYAHLGITSFMTPGWVRPDLVKAEDKKDLTKTEPKDPPTAAARKDATTPASEGKPAAEPAAGDEKQPDEKKPDEKKKGPPSDDAKWLAFSDQQLDGDKGFVEWKPFEHPQLGSVEIGGWKAGFRLYGAATAEAIQSAATDQQRFVSELLAGLPRLMADAPRVEAIGQRQQSWRISVSAANTGHLPTRTAMGVKARRLPPTRWEIDVEPARILSGRKVQGAPAVAPGGYLAAEWVIAGDAGAEVRVKLLSPEVGDQELIVKLEAGKTDEPRRTEDAK